MHAIVIFKFLLYSGKNFRNVQNSFCASCHIFLHKFPVFFSMVAIPVYVRHNILLKPGSTGRVELTVGPKQSMGKVVGVLILVLILYINVVFVSFCYCHQNYDGNELA